MERDDKKAKADKVIEQVDTRKKLEADVKRYYTYTSSTLMWPDSANYKTDWIQVPINEVYGWLDRQAAITRRETDEIRDCADCAEGMLANMQQQVDNLTAERDELYERVRKLTMKIMAMEDRHKNDSERWVGIAHQHQEYLHEIMELRERLRGVGDLQTVQSNCIKELKAERDDLAHELRRARKAAKRWHELASGYRDKAAQFVEIIEALTATLDRKNARIKRLRGKLKRARNK